MRFIIKWRIFIWTFLSSPLWLIAPITTLFEIDPRFAFPLFFAWFLLGSYLGMKRYVKCPFCSLSILNWWFSRRKNYVASKVEQDLRVYLYLLLSVFSVKMAKKYLGELACPNCASCLEKI